MTADEMQNYESNERALLQADFGDNDTDIEQQLDMNEEGPLRGENIEHRIDDSDLHSLEPRELNFDKTSFNWTLSEEGREGDEYSGDEHSSGLQGEESEMSAQPHIDSGVPGQVA